MSPFRSARCLRRASQVLAASAALASPATALAAGEPAGAPARPGSAVYGVASDASGNAIAVGQAASDQMLVVPVSPAGQLGSPLTAGAGTARAVAIQPDRKVLVAGNDNGFVLRRFNADGTVDASFGSGGTARGPEGAARAITVGPCGTIYAAGNITGGDGFPAAAVLRFQANGAVDATFGTGGVAIVPVGRNSRVRGIALQGDRIIAVGGTAPALQVTDAFIAGLRADGTNDPAFNGGNVFYYYHPLTGGFSSFAAVTVDPSGRVVAGGADYRDNGSFALVARLDASGRPDPSFGGDGITTPAASSGYRGSEAIGVNGIAVAGGGEIVAAGAYQDAGFRSPALYAITPAGELDPAVGKGGMVKSEQLDDGGQANAIAVAPDGSLITGGETFRFVGEPTGVVGRANGFGPRPAAPTCGRAGAVTDVLLTPVTGVLTPPPPPPPPPPPAPAKPKVTKAKLSPSTITPKRPGKLTFSLSRAAPVTLTLERKLSGRKATSGKNRGKCGKLSAATRRGARCSYYQRVAGSTRVDGRAGTNTRTVTNKAGRRKLADGTYRLTLTVKGGNTIRLTLKVKSR